LGFQVKLLLHGGRSQVLIGHDVVSFENRSGLMPAYNHGNPFRNPSPDYISYCRSPEVMERASSQVRLGASPIPCLPEIFYYIVSGLIWEDEC